jgi:hypothetical protein
MVEALQCCKRAINECIVQNTEYSGENIPVPRLETNLHAMETSLTNFRGRTRQPDLEQISK